jgi:beta-glucosidase
VNYLRAHLMAVRQAIRAGANLKGYYVWSLFDNFEWSQGYKPRFGIVRVDFTSGKRIPKQSAAWYRDVIAKNGVDE